MMKRILYIVFCALLSFVPVAVSSANAAEQDADSVATSFKGKESKTDSVVTNTKGSEPISSIKEQADKAYAAQKYQEAANLYLKLTKHGQNPDVYYNLGNCYYRLDDIAHSILWYERALLLNPGDEDIRTNLQFVRTKTVDKIVPEEDIFFVSWYHSLLNTMSVSQWVWTGIILFALALISLSLYFFGGEIIIRKIGFYFAVVLFLFVVISNIFAMQQRSRQEHRDRAVVMQESVVVKSAPGESSRDLFLLHTGTSMQILDDTMKDWYQIRLSDGKEGWIPTKALEII